MPEYRLLDLAYLLGKLGQAIFRHQKPQYKARDCFQRAYSVAKSSRESFPTERNTEVSWGLPVAFSPVTTPLARQMTHSTTLRRALSCA